MRKIFIAIVSAAFTVAVMTSLQACQKDETPGGGSGGGGTDPEPEPVPTATVSLQVMRGTKSTGMRLLAYPSENLSDGDTCWFLIDTLETPALHYRATEVTSTSFSSTCTAPYLGRKLYCRAVAVHNGSTIQSDVVTYTPPVNAVPEAVADSVWSNGSIVIMYGHLTMNDGTFDPSLLTGFEMKMTFDAVSDDETDHRDVDVFEYETDGHFRFCANIYDMYWSITSPSLREYYGIVSETVFFRPKITYNGTEYTKPKESTPADMKMSTNNHLPINIPDDAFRKYVSDTYCSGGDVTADVICNYENFIPRLDLSGLGIKSLEGIECFYSIVTLICDSTLLVSTPRLWSESESWTKTNKYLDDTISFRNCPNLEEVNIPQNSGSTILFLDGCPSLKKLHAESRLSSLYCSGCGLTSLDLSEVEINNKLDCSQNRLETLDISGSGYCKKLYCTDNPLLNTAYVSSEQMERYSRNPDLIHKDEHTMLVVKE